MSRLLQAIGKCLAYDLVQEVKRNCSYKADKLNGTRMRLSKNDPLVPMVSEALQCGVPYHGRDPEFMRNVLDVVSVRIVKRRLDDIQDAHNTFGADA